MLHEINYVHIKICSYVTVKLPDIITVIIRIHWFKSHVRLYNWTNRFKLLWLHVIHLYHSNSNVSSIVKKYVHINNEASLPSLSGKKWSHTHAHIHAHTYIHNTFTLTHTNTNTHTLYVHMIHTHTHTHIHTTHIHTHTHTHIIYTHTHTTRTHTHKHMHTHTYTHKHTHTQYTHKHEHTHSWTQAHTQHTKRFFCQWFS